MIFFWGRGWLGGNLDGWVDGKLLLGWKDACVRACMHACLVSWVVVESLSKACLGSIEAGLLS